MPRDTELATKRNAEIYADYNRLTAQETVVLISGKKYYIHLTYQQIMNLLGAMYYLSPRTIEPIITTMTPTAAPITKAKSGV